MISSIAANLKKRYEIKDAGKKVLKSHVKKKEIISGLVSQRMGEKTLQEIADSTGVSMRTIINIKEREDISALVDKELIRILFSPYSHDKVLTTPFNACLEAVYDNLPSFVIVLYKDEIANTLP